MKYGFVVAVVAFAATVSGCKGGAKLDSDLDKVSYEMGFQAGSQFKGAPIDLNKEAYLSGIYEALDGKEKRVKPEEFRAAMGKVQEMLMKKMEEQSEKGKKEGSDYLAKNKEKANVKTTSSGLQYEVITDGTGPMAKIGDKVKVHYTGTLIDGKKFDSSVDRKEPFEFQLNEGSVIKGWTEALTLMKEGSKWKLTIPSELAYGPQGNPPVIPGNSVLLFEVELIKVSAGEPVPPMGEMGHGMSGAGKPAPDKKKKK